MFLRYHRRSGGLDVAVYVLDGLMVVFMDGCVRCRRRVLRCLGLR